MYQLKLTPRAQRELDKLPSEDLERIIIALQQLVNNPRHHGTRKLSGRIYRVRRGDWRIIYAVIDRENLIIVGKIARRSEDTYDKVRDLF